MKRVWLSLLLLVAAGCAANVYTQFPAEGEGDTGTLIIKFSDKMPNVHVVIDGTMVAEDKFTERVEIKGIPVGFRNLRVVGTSQSKVSSIDLNQRIHISPEKERVVLISTPPRSTGYWVYQGLSWLAVMGWVLYVISEQE